MIQGLGSLPYANPGIGQRIMGSLPSLSTGAELIPKGAMLKGGLYGLAGSVGSSLIDKTDVGGQNSNWEQGLQGASQGAGIGAGLGLLGGPFAELSVPAGAAIGGVAGGAIGVLSNVFGGGDDKEADPQVSGEQVLGKALMNAQIDDATTAKILDTYETRLMFASAIEDEASRKAAEQQALDEAGSFVLQAIQQRQQGGGMGAGGTNPASLLALQAQSQQIFAPIAQDIRDTTGLYAGQMAGMMDDLPAAYKPIAQATAAREVMSGNRLADAYMAQAAITPVVQQLTQYQQDYNSFAAQQFQAAMQAGMAAQQGGTSAGGADITALIDPTRAA
jgi:hypothetical protein